MIRGLKRWWQKRHASKVTPRLREILAALGEALPELAGVRAVASGHRGHDSTYYLEKKGARLAVLRLNNPYVTRIAPSADMPFTLAPAEERIRREAGAYAQGFPIKLTPELLWHTHDALVCRYVALTPLPATPNWRVLRNVNRAISALHSVGLTHMDMSPNNVLGDDAWEYFVFIDFEYTPADGVNIHTQRAYDYLRLLESCWKFMPDSIKGDYDLWLRDVADRFGHDAAHVELNRLAPALTRILATPGLGTAIGRVFPN